MLNQLLDNYYGKEIESKITLISQIPSLRDRCQRLDNSAERILALTLTQEINKLDTKNQYRGILGENEFLNWAKSEQTLSNLRNIYFEEILLKVRHGNLLFLEEKAFNLIKTIRQSRDLDEYVYFINAFKINKLKMEQLLSLTKTFDDQNEIIWTGGYKMNMKYIPEEIYDLINKIKPEDSRFYEQNTPVELKKIKFEIIRNFKEYFPTWGPQVTEKERSAIACLSCGIDIKDIMDNFYKIIEKRQIKEKEVFKLFNFDIDENFLKLLMVIEKV